MEGIPGIPLTSHVYAVIIIWGLGMPTFITVEDIYIFTENLTRKPFRCLGQLLTELLKCTVNGAALEDHLECSNVNSNGHFTVKPQGPEYKDSLSPTAHSVEWIYCRSLLFNIVILQNWRKTVVTPTLWNSIPKSPLELLIRLEEVGFGLRPSIVGFWSGLLLSWLFESRLSVVLYAFVSISCPEAT